MANPELIGASSIYGKTVYDTDIVKNPNTTAIVTNATNSSKVLKINSLIIANIDGTADADITVTLRDTAGTPAILSTIAHTVAVPADATLVVISKDTAIYLEEGMAIHLMASETLDLSATCSYEEIS